MCFKELNRNYACEDQQVEVTISRKCIIENDNTKCLDHDIVLPFSVTLTMTPREKT